MTVERPDLSGVPDDVVAYIEWLEKRQRSRTARAQTSVADDDQADDDLAAEAPSTEQVITASASGLLKRTPRHLYGRQRRGGMGVFDAQLPGDDPPALLALAEASATLLLITSHGRIFRRAMSQVPLADEVRSRAGSLTNPLPFRPAEHLVAIVPEPSGGTLILVTERGWVRRIRAGYLGRAMIDGTSFHDIKEGGYVSAAALSPGDRDLLLVSRGAQGIRFREAQVPARGCLGLRVAPEDRVIAVAPTDEESGVFLLSAEGKGTLRLMSGFRANKAPGAGGKLLMKAEILVGAAAVRATEDIFLLSRLSKVIRFPASQVPAKEGVVQGVHCFNLRADEAVAVAVAAMAPL